MAEHQIPGRPLRADARSNRERILRAAAAAFREQGVDVQMNGVAERAGVAVGTVYRHFPTKEALVDALLLERLTTAARAARRAAAGVTDPWAALEAFLRTLAAVQIEDRSLAEFIGGRVPGSAELRQLLNGLFGDFTVLVENARQSGQLRADVEPNDIRVATICVARAVWGDWPDPGWVLERYLSLVLDGLRAPGYTVLGGTPPATAESGIAAALPGRPAQRASQQASTSEGRSPALRGRRRGTPQPFRRGRRGWNRKP